MLLVFDWGGTSVKYGLWNGEQLIKTSSFQTPKDYETLKEKMMLVKTNYGNINISGISISAPGVVDADKQVIRGISAIPYIHHFNIFSDLMDYFSLPVTIENDANCAGLAEVYQGVAKGKKDVLFVVVGTGIGGAIFQNGQLKKGAHLYGGEFGLMILDQEETFSTLGTPVRMAQRYCQRKNIPEGSVSGKEVFALGETKDNIAAEEVEKFYKYLAQGLYSLQFTLDPEVIVLGGGVSQKEGLVEELEKRVKALCEEHGLMDITPEIVACQYKNDANLIGAAVNFFMNN